MYMYIYYIYIYVYISPIFFNGPCDSLPPFLRSRPGRPSSWIPSASGRSTPWSDRRPPRRTDAWPWRIWRCAGGPGWAPGATRCWAFKRSIFHDGNTHPHIPTVIVGGVFFPKQYRKIKDWPWDGKNDLARMHGIEEFLESTRSSRRTAVLLVWDGGWNLESLKILRS